MNSVAESELSLTQLKRLINEAHTSEQKIINQTALEEATNELSKLMNNYDETMTDDEYNEKLAELDARRKRLSDVIQKINNNTWDDRENPILIAKIADLNDPDKLKKTRDYYKYIYKQDANTTYISPTTGGGNSLIFKLMLTRGYLIKIIIISPEKENHKYKGKTIQTATEQDFNKEVRNQETVVSTISEHISPTIFYADILNASQISFLKINNPELKCGVIVMEFVNTESLNSFMCRVINPKYRIRLDTMTTQYLVLFLNEDGDDAFQNSQETIKLLIAKYVAYLFCVGMIGICHGDYGFNNAIISKHKLVLIDYGRSKNMVSDLTREWLNKVLAFIRTPTKEDLLDLTQYLAQINKPIFIKEELTVEQIETYYGWFVNPDIIDAIFTDVVSILKEMRHYRVPRLVIGGKSKSKRKKNKKIGNKNKRTNKPKRKTNKGDKKII